MTTDWRAVLRSWSRRVRPLVVLHADEGDDGFGGTVGVVTLLGGGWAVTASHLLEERDRARERDRSLVHLGVDVREEIELGELDLTLLRCDGDGPKPALWVPRSDVEPGLPVVALGSGGVDLSPFIDRQRARFVRPEGTIQMWPWPAAGTLSALNGPDRLIAAVSVLPAHSGGPVLDVWGRLVSLTTEIHPRGTVEALDGTPVGADLTPMPAPWALRARLRELGVPVPSGGRMRAAWRLT